MDCSSDCGEAVSGSESLLEPGLAALGAVLDIVDDKHSDDEDDEDVLDDADEHVASAKFIRQAAGPIADVAANSDDDDDELRVSSVPRSRSAAAATMSPLLTAAAILDMFSS